jgi:Ca-activated chloride channel family protein
MHLANRDIWLWILLAVLALTGLIIWSFMRRRSIVRRAFSEGQKASLLSNFSPGARLFRTIILGMSLFFLGLAILDPRWGSQAVEREMSGIDIVFLMDISASMDTEDVPGSRLGYAKQLSQQLMSLLAGNRIGVAGYAGFGFKVIPLTADINAAILFLNELSTSMIDIQGSNLEDGLKTAMELFDKQALTHRAIVVFTDGEDYEFSPLEQAKQAKQSGIRVYTLGIGTPEGAKVPILDQYGAVKDYMMEGGKTVVSRLNETLLKSVAQESGGIYAPGTEDGILQIAKNLGELEKSKFGSNIYEFMEPQYQYFLTAAVLLLLIFILMPDRKLNTRKPAVPLAVLLLALLLPVGGYASDASDGVKSYKKSEYQKALQFFQKAITADPKNELLRYNEANSYYQMKQYAPAMTGYLSLTNSKNNDAQAKAFYNLGNAFAAQKDYKNALLSYKYVLDHADPKSEVFQRALKNFVFLKQKFPPQQQKDDQKEEKDNKDEENKDQNKDQKDDKKEKEPKNPDNQQKQQQQQAQQQKPISPTDIENLLNLIEEEEKKHLTDKEKPTGKLIYPKIKY